MEETVMRMRSSFLRMVPQVFLLPLLLAAAGCQSSPKSDTHRDEMRADVRTMERSTLDDLYTRQPSARDTVKNAAGYAVFSNFGMKILVAGGGSGEGSAVDNRTGQVTYMKMAEVQAGLGMGVKKFKLVWVFETRQAFDEFVNSGWTLGGQATAAAKAGGQGGALAGAIAVAPGVWVYQLTDTGLALELTAKGTKYYKDDGLN
jgi:lipid-binding SYLF domain-containing protein